MNKKYFAVSFSFPIRRSLALLGMAIFASSPALAADLLEIYSQAVNSDPVVRQARAEYQATHTNVNQSQSQLLPDLTLNATTARETTGPENPRIVEGVVVQPGHSFADGFNSKSYGLSIRQNLINFQAWYAYQSVLKSDQAAAMNLALVEQELIMRVATAYFEVLRALDNLSAYQAELDAAERILEQTNERFEVGLAPITDVNESQAAYDLARANFLVQENLVSQSFEALEAITGRPYESIAELDEAFPIEPVGADIDEWVNTALGSNLEILVASYTHEAREQQSRAARAALFPTVDLSAGYNWNESGTSFSFITGASERSNISLNFSFPLYSGGLLRAQRRQAYYNEDASEEILLRTQRSTTLNTRNSYRSVQSDVLTIEARERAVESARSQLEATEAGVQAGTRNIVDLVVAQRLLFQAERDYANSRYEYVINTLELKQATGLLNPQDVIDLNQWLIE